MKLKDHDLKQIDQEYLKRLPPEKLLEVSGKLLEDLKEARDRLNQTSENSSRPSGSFAPWEGSIVSDGSPTEEVPAKETEEAPHKDEEKKKTGPEDKKPAKNTEPKKKAGKQAGAKGHGRKVELPVTDVKIHYAEECAACEEKLGEEAKFEAKTGLYVLDVAVSKPGLEVSHIKHLYGDTHCECGHITRTEPGRCEAEKGWDVELTEWHLVGPMLVSLIIALSLRMRLSRARIQEFLHDWLGIYLSIGVINQALAEGGRAVEPIEEELIAELKQAELLYADETRWKEKGQLRWLWVLIGPTVTLFLIGGRGWDMIAELLEEFAGWLMSDGYKVYRKYAKRLRCLAHLVRKARGLSESLNPEAQAFGEKTLEYLAKFIEGVYRARAAPTEPLKEEFVEQLAEMKMWCEKHQDSTHKKTRQLAREFLNDWEAIWSVLEHPDLPITNNIAERALRHWIISRKISYGTRTPQGSRAFALLASVIDTCRQRQTSPWPYLAEVIAERRKGNPAPPLPTIAS